MEAIKEITDKFNQSITLKAVVVGILTLLMLIPGAMIENLVSERQQRSTETIQKINSKWSNEQTLSGPILQIPYQITVKNAENKSVVEEHMLYLTPDHLVIKSKLYPEERHLGIYKSILYKSELRISGNFQKIASQLPPNSSVNWSEAAVRLGITDLRGLTNELDFMFAGSHFSAETSASKDVVGEGLIIPLKFTQEQWLGSNMVPFQCVIQLKGSSSLNFIPTGRNTKVEIEGGWKSPGFTGGFSPEYQIKGGQFIAKWNILHFNRNIPSTWIDNQVESFKASSFGVNLVDTVDHYQQNMRSAKYSFMFIALTFVIFLFVELLTRKRIHPLQYLLVGVALILFYSLLLSLSEQMGFGISYLIATSATVALIVTYVRGIFKNRTHIAVLGGFLLLLYTFLYVILQLEDIALLIGSIGLFVILGTVMYFSGKIEWYKRG